MSKTPLEIHAHAIALHTKQQSCHIIANKLGTTTSIISHIIKCYGATWKLEDKRRLGHPHILNERDDLYLARLVEIKKHSIVIQCQRVFLRGFKYYSFP